MVVREGVEEVESVLVLLELGRLIRLEKEVG